jgi:hypothetical protein
MISQAGCSTNIRVPCHRSLRPAMTAAVPTQPVICGSCPQVCAKGTVTPASKEAEFDFVANNPRLTLFQCHQRLHMNLGFMALFK